MTGLLGRDEHLQRSNENDTSGPKFGRGYAVAGLIVLRTRTSNGATDPIFRNR